MNKVLRLVCVAIIFATSLWVLLYPKINHERPDYRFEIVEGKKISVSNGDMYVLGFIENCTGIGFPCIKKMNGWNLTLNESLWISNVLKYFDGSLYAAGADVVKIRNGKIEWMKNIMVKRVSYEGTRENPVPVYYEDILNIFDIESDGKHLYINTRDGIVKTDENLNVIWAVELLRKNGNRFGDLNDDISVSDGIYATRWNHVVKLNKDGEFEWAAGLVSDEKVRIPIPEKKREAAERGGKEVPEFVETERYKIDLYSVYAENDYVYVVGLVSEHLGDHIEVYPFLAKLTSSGELVWAKIVNVTYPNPEFYALEGKIIKDKATFVAWFSNYVLFIFDENGEILSFYVLNGEIEDVALMNDTIYIAALPIQAEYIEDQKPVVVEKRKVEIEKIPAVSIPLNTKAVKKELEVERIECYSKDWEERILIPH